MQDGLACGQRVVFVGLDDEARFLQRRLGEDGVPIEHLVATGQLVLTEHGRAAELFAMSDERFADALLGTVHRALDDGYSGVFAAGGSQPTGAGTHEAVFDPLSTQTPITFLCLYDRRRMTDEGIRSVQRLHAADRGQPAVFDDGALRITTPRAGRLHLAGELDVSNRDEALAALQHEDVGPSTVELDLGSLRFLDASGARVVFALASSTDRRPLPVRRVAGLAERLLRLLDPHADCLELPRPRSGWESQHPAPR